MARRPRARVRRRALLPLAAALVASWALGRALGPGLVDEGGRVGPQGVRVHPLTLARDGPGGRALAWACGTPWLAPAVGFHLRLSHSGVQPCELEAALDGAAGFAGLAGRWFRGRSRELLNTDLARGAFGPCERWGQRLEVTVRMKADHRVPPTGPPAEEVRYWLKVVPTFFGIPADTLPVAVLVAGAVGSVLRLDLDALYGAKASG